MPSSRRSLAIALAVVMLLAMLVPAALAAPEATSAVAITAPTTAAPAYVNPEAKDNTFKVKYDLTVDGLQVDNVMVTFTLLQKYDVDHVGFAVLQPHPVILGNADLATGVNHLEYKFEVDDHDSLLPGFPKEIDDGWYSIQVCAKDIDRGTPEFCTVQQNAVLVQDSGPVVDLEKPGAEDWEGFTFVTGKSYYLQGQASDVWGLTKVVFEYCDISNNRHGKPSETHCNWNDPGWVWIADGVATGQPNQYKAAWDSTIVPDDFGAIRMCATNHVGLTNCANDRADDWKAWQDAHKVAVTNHFTLHLEPGWNLVSLPIIPYDPAITSVLAPVIATGNVKRVDTFAPGQQTWTPTGIPANTLTNMYDGQGYWIWVDSEADVTVAGTYAAVGPYTPPSYPVAIGWNLTGFTHWGSPWWMQEWNPVSAADYLSMSVGLYAQSMWAYDAEHEVFWQQQMMDPMALGHGYWLAMSQAGTIRP